VHVQYMRTYLYGCTFMDARRGQADDCNNINGSLSQTSFPFSLSVIDNTYTSVTKPGPGRSGSAFNHVGRCAMRFSCHKLHILMEHHYRKHPRPSSDPSASKYSGWWHQCNPKPLTHYPFPWAFVLFSPSHFRPYVTYDGS